MGPEETDGEMFILMKQFLFVWFCMTGYCFDVLLMSLEDIPQLGFEKEVLVCKMNLEC